MIFTEPPGPRTVCPVPFTDRVGDAAVAWLTCGQGSEELERWQTFDIPRRSLDCKFSAVKLLKCLLDGSWVTLRGDIDTLARLSRRLSDVLKGMKLSDSERWCILYRCTVPVRRRKPEIESFGEFPCDFWPGIMSPMMEASDAKISYVPLPLLIWLLESVWGRDYREVRPAFFKESGTIWEPCLGCSLVVDPEVLVPTREVVDLLLSAFFDPRSSLSEDITKGQVIEPCTGSGILGVALARLGAMKVISSDIHQGSADCATRNVERLGLSGVVEVLTSFGIPPGRDGDVIVVNPPWFGRLSGAEIPSCFRRCFEDPEFNFLKGLLNYAARHTSCKAFYLFLGREDPLQATTESRNRLVLESSGWERDVVWNSGGNISLYRLCRD